MSWKFFFKKIAVYSFVFSIFLPSSYADESSFYAFNEQWRKESRSGTTKAQALSDTFSSALLGSAVASGTSTGMPAPSSISRSLRDICSAGGTVEIEQNQSLFLKLDTPVVKFISTDDGIVVMDTVESSTLRIAGSGVGSTFVHVWDESGRKTFSLRVKQPKVLPNLRMEKQIELYEKTRPFKFSYDNSRGAFYAGDKYRQMKRSGYDFTQRGSFVGDTPYGELSGRAQTQNDLGRVFLTDAQLALRDGKVGNYRNFNAVAGDSFVDPNFMVFSEARVRGALLEHWDDSKRVQWSAFRGREESSMIGTLTPGVVSERTLNSYLTGETVNFKLNEQSRLRAGYFQGSGRDRNSNSVKSGTAGEFTTELGPHVVFKSEVDRDTSRYAQRHAFLTTFKNFNMKNEVRDVSKNFFSLLGTPGRQGEIGYLLDASGSPTDWWSMKGSLDIFRDRLIFNPEDPSSVNIHTDFSMRFIPSESSSLVFSYQDIDDTGRIGPMKLRVYSSQYTQRINVLGHKASVFTRYQNRNNRALTTPLSDYQQNQIAVGFYTEIFWGIYLSMQKECSLLYEPILDRTTYPSVFSYSLDYSRQLVNLPLYLDMHLRVRDEEETESINSFMAGEDSTEVSGGIRYKPSDDLEVFLNGSFTQYVPENKSTAPSQRVEAQFLTGMNYIYDTGWRWAAKGSFNGYVFKDANGDGIRQAGEAGITGVMVTVSDGQKTATNADGFYEFKAVSGKKVTLTMDNASIPYGYTPTGSLMREADIVQKKTVRIDFGMTPRSEISGIVFSDVNGDGKYDTSDAGVRKVKITLEDGQSAWSNAIGVYSFPNVAAAEHTASLSLATLPEGYLPVDVPIKKFTTFEGIRYQLNFPLKAVRQVTGRVFLDANRNKIFDPTDRPQEGIRVFLGDLAVVTDNEGWYLFDNVKKGSYQLKVDPSTLEPGWSVPPIVLLDIPAEPTTRSNQDIAISAV